MEEKLNITCEEQKDHILLKIEGRIDGYWSKQLDEYLEDTLRAGNHKVAVDLENVNYLSSLGIRILIKHATLFRQINGGFGIVNASDNVMNLLKMVGLDTILKWQNYEETTSESKHTEISESDGYIFEITSLKSENPIQVRLTGNPEKIRTGGFSTNNCQSVDFGKNHFGIGLGAIGLDFEDCQSRFGDFIALGDSVAYSPAGKSNSPDFMIKTGSLLPSVKLLYGILFEGDFSKLISFTSNDQTINLKFSDLITKMFEISGYEQLALVMIAETSGMVGLSLNCSPVTGQNKTLNPFAFPEVREQVNFTTEPGFRKMMTITAGIASKTNDPELNRYLRPLAPGSEINQHFHSAIFSYHAIKKNNIDLDETIMAFFEQDKILSVLHLINDTREFTGIGESEFKNGVCWIGKVNSLAKS